MALQPQYKFDEFQCACEIGSSKVQVTRGSRETAISDFNLRTDSRILEFIANGGLEKPRFINSGPWDNNPDKNALIMVDAYGFYSGKVYGYIAFLFQQKTDRWMIKSFKKNRNADTRNFTMKEQLTKLL